MAFDITPYVDMSPKKVRELIRKGVIDFPTAGMCRGYAQANMDAGISSMTASKNSRQGKNLLFFINRVLLYVVYCTTKISWKQEGIRIQVSVRLKKD